MKTSFPMMALVILTTTVCAASHRVIPAMTEEETQRLVTARDGHDHQEEAFIALIEHVRSWPGIEADIRAPHVSTSRTFIQNPEAHRGELTTLTGRLEQRASLQSVYGDTEEWFLRLSSGEPAIVFVTGATQFSEIKEGQHIGIAGRFYKRIDAIDRRGNLQQYAAFVGTAPRKATSTTELVQLWVVAIPVVALLIAFGLLVLFIRRHRGASRPRVRAFRNVEIVTDEVNLPDDPADALAELKRRADTESVHADH